MYNCIDLARQTTFSFIDYDSESSKREEEILKPRGEATDSTDSEHNNVLGERKQLGETPHEARANIRG